MSDSIACRLCGHRNPHVSQRLSGEAPCPICGNVPAPGMATPGLSEDDVPLEWKVGDRILNLYDVRAVHEGGAMGRVYRVRHLIWGMELAVKSPRAEYFRNEEDRREFTEEAERWVKLGMHPHIATCYYVRYLGLIPRLFAEYVEGGSLADWIGSRRLYEGGPARALVRMIDVAIQFAWGLQFAHDEGLIHQDVKPGNVLITPDGLAKVVDFGLARARAKTSGASGAALAGMTAAYASPEQVEAFRATRSGRPASDLTTRTDLWSWAVSILEMFLGEAAWTEGWSVGGVLAMVDDLDSAPPIPRLPPALRELLAHCFQPAPDRRPVSLAACADRLREIYREAAGAEYPRRAPRAAPLRSDSLNNRAVSLADMNRMTDARALLEEALTADPQHLYATYNRGLVSWRLGEITDEELLLSLEKARTAGVAAWEPLHLLARIHAERGDRAAAARALDDADRIASDEHARHVLTTARSSLPDGVSPVLELEWPHGDVSGLDVTSDGRRAAAISSYGDLCVWDVASRRTILRQDGWGTSTDSPTQCVAISDDGRLLVTVAKSVQLRFWDLVEGRQLREVHAHDDVINEVVMSRDGRQVYSAGQDGVIAVWEASTGRCILRIRNDRDVKALAVTPSGHEGFSVDSGGRVRLWNLRQGSLWRTLGEHRGARTAAVSVHGGVLLTAGTDREAAVWDIAQGKRVATLRGTPTWINDVALNGSGLTAATCSGDVRLWSVAHARCLATLPLKAARIAIARDADLLVSLGAKSPLQIWKLGGRTRAPHAIARPVRSEDSVSRGDEFRSLLDRATALLRGGSTADALEAVRQCRSVEGHERDPEAMALWRRLTRTSVRRGVREVALHAEIRTGHENVYALDVSRDGTTAVTGDESGRVRVWDLQSGECRHELRTHEEEVTSATITADGTRALSTGRDRRTCVWNLRSGQLETILPNGDAQVESAAVTPDGRFAMTVGWESSCVLWDLQRGAEILRPRGYVLDAFGVALSPDAQIALVASKLPALTLFDLTDGSTKAELTPHKDGAHQVVLTSDSRRAVSVGSDGVYLWEVTERKRIRTIRERFGCKVGLTPDGRVLLLAAGDTVVLQELESGAELASWRAESSGIGGAAISADAQTVATASTGMLRVWHVEWDLAAPAEPWDERARSCLDAFLRCRRPLDGLRREGAPQFGAGDVDALMAELRTWGYGFIPRDVIDRELAAMAK